MYDTLDTEIADEAELRRLEAEYCSWGDTVHYMPEPKFFEGCDGAFMFDAQGRRFLDLVDAGFRTEKKVSAYARRMGVPEKRLQAATAAAFGKSPKALIDERAALEAKRLLVYGGGSVKEIAFALGFEETTNFVKWFRKHAGTTPAGFRARYLP